MVDPFKSYIEVGYIQRSHGMHGELLIDLRFKILELKDFVADLDGAKVPFLVENCFISDRKAYVKIAGIDDLSGCEFLKGAKVFANKSILQGDDALLCELVGYEVVDKREGRLGKVSTIEQMPMQNMIVVKNCEKEILIPYHKDLVVRVDHINKKIISILPLDFFDR